MDPFAVRDVIYTDKKKEIKEPDDFAKQRRFERDKESPSKEEEEEKQWVYTLLFLFRWADTGVR